MKQTHKLRAIFSVGLSCVSLFFLITMVGCLKKMVKEEIPSTKAGFNSNPNPFLSAEQVNIKIDNTEGAVMGV